MVQENHSIQDNHSMQENHSMQDNQLVQNNPPETENPPLSEDSQPSSDNPLSQVHLPLSFHIDRQGPCTTRTLPRRPESGGEGDDGKCNGLGERRTEPD